VIELDLNNPEFQDNWLALQRDDAMAILASLRQIRQIDWRQLQTSKGLRYELIQSRRGPNGERLHSIRISRKVRAVVMREGNVLRFLSLHPDHDSAYR
jgi:hypothetical protein